MRDPFGRSIEYARISITDRCNLRCQYCMPEEGVVKKRHADILTFDEIVRICRCFSLLGINRLKVTGGEPLVRLGAPELIGRLKAIPGMRSVTLTTNGILLPEYAGALAAAGLDGVNVSLDTLNPDAFRELTRGGDVHQTLAGLDAALAAGIPSVKVNCVPMENSGDDVAAVAALARNRPIHVRFIEMMPVGFGAGFRPLARERVREAIEKAFGRLESSSGTLGNGPAKYYSLSGFTGKIGFIDTLDHGLCGRCNRLRLTSEGVLKACLHMDVGMSIKSALAEEKDDALLSMIEKAISLKPPHHNFANQCAPNADKRGMSEIGG